jgi:hypothetical protein
VRHADPRLTIQEIITSGILEVLACWSPGLPVFFRARSMGLALIRSRTKRWASPCWLVADARASSGTSRRRSRNHEVASHESEQTDDHLGKVSFHLAHLL